MSAGGGAGLGQLIGTAGGGVSDIFSGLAYDWLKPSVPTLNEVFQPVLGKYYGTFSPSLQLKIDTYQSKLDSATSAKNRAAYQAKIDSLNEQAVRAQKGAYLPQFMESLGKYLPQFQQQAHTAQQQSIRNALSNQLQFGLPAAQSIYGQQQALAPEFFQNRSALAGQLGSQLGQGLTPQDIAFFREQSAQGESAAGRYGSPLSSANIARYLTQQNLQQQQLHEQQMQNFLNTFQLPAVPNLFQPESFSAAGLAGSSLSPANPADLMNLQANLEGIKYAQGNQFANTLAQGIGSLTGFSPSGYAGAAGFGGGGGMSGGGGGIGGGMGGLGSLFGGFGGGQNAASAQQAAQIAAINNWQPPGGFSANLGLGY